MTSIYCEGCGDSLEKSPAVQIREGRYQLDGTFCESGVWGSFHPRCFRRSMKSPRAALDEIVAIQADERRSDT